MKIWLLALSLLPLSFSVAAEKPTPFYAQLQKYCEIKKEQCDTSAAQPSAQKEIDKLFALSCRQFYQENRCDEAKKLMSASDRQDVLSCSASEICRDQQAWTDSKCMVEGFTLQTVGVGMLGGAVTGGAAAYFGSVGAGGLTTLVGVGIPLLLYSTSKDEEQCNSDLQFKKMSIIVHNLGLLPDDGKLDFEGADKSLLKMQCSDLRSFLRTRAETIALKRGEQQRLSVDKPKFQSPISQAWIDTVKSNRCLNPNAVAKRFCSTMSKIVAAALAGGISAQGSSLAVKAGLARGEVVAASSSPAKVTAPSGVKSVTASQAIRDWGKTANSAVRIKKVNEVTVAVEKALEKGAGNRVETLNAMLKDKNILPENGVMHIVGSSNSAEEWVLPLLARKDVKLVLSEHGVGLDALAQQLRSEKVLNEVWRIVEIKYKASVQSSDIKTFADFKNQVRERVTLKDGYDSKTYTDSRSVIRPPNGSNEVPLADVMLLNQPHIYDARGATSSAGRAASGLMPSIRSQVQPDTGLLWVASESVSRRLGADVFNGPSIKMPASKTSFDMGSGLVTGPHGAGFPSSSLVTESFLIFP